MVFGLIKASVAFLIIGTSTAYPWLQWAECGPVVSALGSRLIFEFPNSSVTAIENVGITNDGKLLLNTITGPQTYLLDPNVSSPSPSVVANYTNATSSLGIAQVEANKFAIAVGNYTIATKASMPGSFAIWTLDISKPSEPIAKLLTTIPEAEALNGMTAVQGSPGLVLVADSVLGATFTVNVTSGVYSVGIKDPLFAKLPTFPLGINGLHAVDGTLYFTNSALKIFGKVGITPAGTATGPAVTIVSGIPGNIFDDFAIDSQGNAFISNHPHALTEVTACGLNATVANSTIYDNPTSAIFASSLGGDCTLYVVTDGSLTAEPTVGGQVYAFDVC